MWVFHIPTSYYVKYKVIIITHIYSCFLKLENISYRSQCLAHLFCLDTYQDNRTAVSVVKIVTTGFYV